LVLEGYAILRPTRSYFQKNMSENYKLTIYVPNIARTAFAVLNLFS